MRAEGRCRIAVADLLDAPRADARRVSQCPFGERVDVLDLAGHWYRVRVRRDGYVGHVHRDDLDTIPSPSSAGRVAVEATDGPSSGASDARPHRVGVRATLLFAEPDIKSPLRLRVPFGAELDVLDGSDPREGRDGSDDGPAGRTRETDGANAATVGGAAAGGHGPERFARVRAAIGGRDAEDVFVWREHCLAPGGSLAGSPLDVARRLYDGAPYLWGGCTPDGADCSGLLQGAAIALGLHLPRDSGEQERFLEHVVPWPERAASDAVFWPGHVGLLVDPDTLFHATAHTLATAVEPLRAVVARAGPPSSIRRLPTRPG